MAPPAEPHRVLLTGLPGCGKTTVILRTLPLLSQPAAGFYTEEVRDAKAGGPGPRVGKYAVDLGSFEDIGVRALEAGLREPHHLLVLDELGKMELLSGAFVTLVEQVFRSPNPLLGTILYRRHPLGDHFRRAPGVELIQVTTENRDSLPRKLAGSFRAAPSAAASPAPGGSGSPRSGPRGCGAP